MFIILALLCVMCCSQCGDHYRKNIASIEILHDEIRKLQEEINALVIERTQKIEHLRRLLKPRNSELAAIAAKKEEFQRIVYKDTQCSIQ